MTKERQLEFLNEEIERLDGVEEKLENAKNDYQRDCLKSCVDTLNRYRSIRDSILRA